MDEAKEHLVWLYDLSEMIGENTPFASISDQTEGIILDESNRSPCSTLYFFLHKNATTESGQFRLPACFLGWIIDFAAIV